MRLLVHERAILVMEAQPVPARQRHEHARRADVPRGADLLGVQRRHNAVGVEEHNRLAAHRVVHNPQAAQRGKGIGVFDAAQTQAYDAFAA